jgi:hypothetical protein
MENNGHNEAHQLISDRAVDVYPQLNFHNEECENEFFFRP